MGQKAVREAGPESPEGKRLDLSVTQVAGTSLATVAAALLASKLGVYGTIVGAGVVSVVATAGGPVIQHVFRRTGAQLRGTARPQARQVPGEEELRADPPSEEFGAATVHGTRVRGWKRTAMASAAAFALAIGGLGTYEAIAGTSVSKGGDTLLSAGTRKSADHRPQAPRPGTGTGTGTDTGEKGEQGKGGEQGGKTPESGTSPSPSHAPGGRGRSQSPRPDPSPSDSGDPAPDPSPSKPTPKPDPTPSPGASASGSGSGPGAGTTGQAS